MTLGFICGCRSYIPEAQAGSQRVDDVLGQVGVVRVPDQADGDDLGTVEQDASDAELLAALTLRKRRQPLHVKA